MASHAAWAIDRYRPMLRLYVQQLQFDRRLQARFDVSDLVQDALLKAHEQLHTCRARSEGELIQWLRGILDNAFIDGIRRETAQKRDARREQAVLAALGESSVRLDRFLASRQAPPDCEVQQREELARLTEAIDQLPDDQRQAILLRDFMGCPVSDIARQMNCTEKSAAGLLYRARLQLRKALPVEGQDIVGR